MSLKKLAFNAPLRSTKVVDVYQREKVFTNDKETVELNFTVTDMAAEDLTTATAEVLLYMKDGSFFQVTDVTKTDNVFTYVMSDTQGKHPGLAKTQLVVTIGTKKYASQLFEFFVNAGLDGVVANEVMIQDWTTLTAEARDFIDQAELDEAQRIANENERITAENQRINDFSSKADKIYVDAQLNDIEQDKAEKTDVGLLSGLLTTAKTSIVNAINELFNNKANKAQEAWITPTLLNGMTEFSPVRYMKDNFGFVIVKGEVNNASQGLPAFRLPLGYRVSQITRFACVSNNQFIRITITTQGDVVIDGTVNNARASLDGIRFKAEV